MRHAEPLRVLVTGSEGFIGRNLCIRVRESPHFVAIPISRRTTERELQVGIAECDAVVHLAGVNRPQNPAEFGEINRDFTAQLATMVAARGDDVPVVFASSTQAASDSPYGRSKRGGEEALLALVRDPVAQVHIFRLPNVFGKWSKPDYNSVVATFCHNIARGLPIVIRDPASPLTLVYIDDLLDAFMAILAAHSRGECLPDGPHRSVQPSYTITVGELATRLRQFHGARRQLSVDRVGVGFLRALYATYMSFLPAEDISYLLERHIDPRGAFAEVLRTNDSGQISYFTANPGITRGGHYHHTKCEKFLVVSGQARFRFRHALTESAFTLEASADAPRVVDTAPGWAHDVTNIGDTELVVLVWASESFDRTHPDTIPCRI